MFLHDADWLLVATVTAMLVLMSMTGCTTLRDAHEKRQAVIRLIEAQARVVDSCQSWHVDAGERKCGLETWPVTVSQKTGEPDNTLIRLPSITSVFTGGLGE